MDALVGPAVAAPGVPPPAGSRRRARRWARIANSVIAAGGLHVVVTAVSDAWRAFYGAVLQDERAIRGTRAGCVETLRGRPPATGPSRGVTLTARFSPARRRARAYVTHAAVPVEGATVADPPGAPPGGHSLRRRTLSPSPRNCREIRAVPAPTRRGRSAADGDIDLPTASPRC